MNYFLKYSLVIFLLNSPNILAQQENQISVIIDALIEVKKVIESEKSSIGLYKIQIYSGSKERADYVLRKFKSSFGDVWSEIIFETPNYKVHIGNYTTRLEADRKLILLKKEFKGAFVL